MPWPRISLDTEMWGTQNSSLKSAATRMMILPEFLHAGHTGQGRGADCGCQYRLADA